MKHASYKAAVKWIAENDSAGDDNDIETLKGFVTVLLVADLFDVDNVKVAQDVYKRRHSVIQS